MEAYDFGSNLGQVTADLFFMQMTLAKTAGMSDNDLLDIYDGFMDAIEDTVQQLDLKLGLSEADMEIYPNNDNGEDKVA